ncbi:MAG: hypothetical protein KatS3mg057_2454 [Herpetosiphonaceae bacterium]|nr:MAG: hypothetical protein KatS3mg057_2454 [Herpetosiphonaceae bacterium]
MEGILRVLLLQLPVPNNPGANIPLAAGYLKAWAAREGLLDQVAVELMPRDIADRAGDALLVDAIVARRPDILGLSLYTWNSERSLAIAGQVKQALPELVVVGGGPEVQADNNWLLNHPALDIAVPGEGEQTFADLLRVFVSQPRHGAVKCVSGCSIPARLSDEVSAIPGIAYKQEGKLIFTPPRAAIEDLSIVPSPYLSGYLELRPGEMALIECSRWCPYRCTFCLYGRNMGTRLGRRYFPAGRVAAEVAWAKEQGAGAVHFVEANLNLLPFFRELMARLQAINADRSLRLYAELRGEHLNDEAADALLAAGLYAAEVGLQSANQAALAAVDRRTNLLKWAEGARRLYARGIEVFLDVILGLPADDRKSILATLDWIAEQELGPYDIFTLQVLPGTGVRSAAARWGLRYQERPPYYVLETDRLDYSELRALRWELRERAGLDPLAVEGMPEPIFEQRALDLEPPQGIRTQGWPVDLIEIDCAAPAAWEAEGRRLARSVAAHLTLVVHHPDLSVLRHFCWPVAAANPTIHWDVVLAGAPPAAELRALRDEWPHEIGYLDRVAVYRLPRPEPPYSKTTPRLFIIQPLDTPVEPLAYEGLAEMIWQIDEADPVRDLDHASLRGGSGILIAGSSLPAVEGLAGQLGWRIWRTAPAACPTQY